MNRMGFKNPLISKETGLSLPIALFLVLAITAASSIFSNSSTQNLREIKITESVNDSFYVAEGALQDFTAQLGVYSQLWREKVNLTTIPNSYTQYNPLTYAGTNGIPTCSGNACQRKMYPVGGGLLKNFGPLSGAGSTVNAAATITQQLNPASLPPADITINGRNAWYQVERLDDTTPNSNSIGASLSNYDPHGASSAGIRYRVTAVAQRTLKGKAGFSTVVAVLELPPT